MSLDDAAEELASDLGADKAEVREKLETLQSYSVPVEEAKQSIRRDRVRLQGLQLLSDLRLVGAEVGGELLGGIVQTHFGSRFVGRRQKRSRRSAGTVRIRNQAVTGRLRPPGKPPPARRL